MTDQDNLRVLKQADTLFHQGDPGDCAYIIESGELEISSIIDGEKVILCHLGPGEIVGEMAVIDGSDRTASAIANTATQLLVVTENQLTERIDQADPILRLLVQILLKRYRSRLSPDLEHGIPRQGSRLVTTEVVLDYVTHGIDKIRLDTELKEALQQHQLAVHYQPLLDVKNRRIAGFEALTRWDHPKRGFISPELFISLAEETSLIGPVGLFVFDTACRELLELQQQIPNQRLFMSINVSMKQILDKAFVNQAIRITDELGIDRADIKLEITEGMKMDVSSTRIWIDLVRSAGFHVSLDDFGAGYSSLATLLSLDVDIVKLDRVFILNALQRSRDERMLSSIVSMVQGMNLITVVEGVETEDELELISRMGCDFAQGYLIGKPLSLQQAHQVLNGLWSVSDSLTV